MHSGAVIVIVLCALGILSGVAVIWMSMQSRRQIREMEHRERLAMIERGLVPAPESDPGAFDRKFATARAPESASASRTRSGGVTMISLGLAFMFMLTFAAGKPGIGVGIGGAFALLGAGFFINSLLMSRTEAPRPPTEHS